MSRRSTMVVAVVGLFLALAVGGVLSTGAGAASSTTVRVVPDAVTVQEDGTASASVVVTNANNGIGAMNLSLTSGPYDAVRLMNVKVPDRQYPVEFVSRGNYSVSTEEIDVAGSGEVTLLQFTIEADEPGTVPLDLTVNRLEDRNGNAYDVTAVEDGSVTVEMDGPGGDVSLTADESIGLSDPTSLPDRTTRWRLDLVDADRGIGAAEITVSLENGSAGTITGADLDGTTAEEVTVRDSGTTVDITASDMDVTGEEWVRFGTVTIQSGETGTTQIDLEAVQLHNRDGDLYRITGLSNDSLRVAPPGETARVRLAEPSKEVPAGERPTFDVVAENLTEGTGGHLLCFRVGDRQVVGMETYPDSTVGGGYHAGPGPNNWYCIEGFARAETLDGQVTIQRITLRARETHETVSPTLRVGWIIDADGRLYRVPGHPATTGQASGDPGGSGDDTGTTGATNGDESDSTSTTAGTGPVRPGLTIGLVLFVFVAVKRLGDRR